MTTFPSADLDALLEDGTTVTYATDPAAKGVYRVAEVEVASDEGTVRELHPTVILRKDALPSLPRLGVVSVGGVNYKVRDILRMANDQFRQLVLVEVVG